MDLTHTYPPAASDGRSRNMRAIKRTGTKPEIELRRLLHGMGLRFRKDYRLDLNGGRVRPDIVFTKRRLAVFLDSCFWHACPEHGRKPTVNEWYWAPKLARTVERDRTGDALLTSTGWFVVHVWEHDDVEKAAERIFELVVSKSAMGDTA